VALALLIAIIVALSRIDLRDNPNFWNEFDRRVKAGMTREDAAKSAHDYIEEQSRRSLEEMRATEALPKIPAPARHGIRVFLAQGQMVSLPSPDVACDRRDGRSEC
jgi:hypothetical protein